MKAYSLNCEVLTPLFLAGAKQRGSLPELRPPSFRGAMRFWYRALLGGSTLLGGNDPLKTLHLKEGEVFGTTERGSAVGIRLSPSSLPSETYQKERAIRTPTGDYMPTGKDYLLWSMSSSGKPNTPRFQAARDFISPGNHFRVTLHNHLDANILNKGLVAFWLLSNLGAIGARANRGAGSFQAVGQNTPFPFKICSSIQELRGYLRDGILACLRTMDSNGWGNLSANVIPEFDILHPEVCSIWIVAGKTPWNSYQQALNGLGEALRDYRSRFSRIGKQDHDAVLDWFESGGRRVPVLNRPVFGLPIPFRYSQGGPVDVIVSTKGERRGSPLHMRITRLANRQFVGVLTLFEARFLPDKPKKEELSLQERRWKTPPPQDYQVIKDFIQTFAVKEQVPL